MAGRGNKSTQFTSTYQPKNRRKPDFSGARLFLERVKVDMPDMVIGRKDFYDLLEILLSADKEYIMQISKNENVPVSLLCIIKAIKTDIEEGTTKTVDSLLDRLYGRRMELTGADGKDLIPAKIDVSKLTDEQLKAIAEINVE